MKTLLGCVPSPSVCLSLCVCLSLYLLVGLLLGHCGRYEAWLTRKDMTIQIQGGNMITYRRDREEQASSLDLFEDLALIKKRK